MNKRHTLFLYAASAICWVIQASGTTTLFLEDFGGESSNPLNETTPSNSSPSWTAASNFNADGSTTSGSECSALLAFTPSDDSVYTLQVSMKKPVGNGWAMFGFSEQGTTSTALWKNNPSEVGPIMLWRNTGSVESYLGGGVGNPGLADKVEHGEYNEDSIELGIVIDTSVSDEWRIDYTINDSVVRTENNFSEPSNLNFVGLSQNTHATNKFTSFELSQSSYIPEPGHYALIIGFLALGHALVCRRIPAI